MSMERAKKNPWPLRILIASMLCFGIGSITLIGQMDTFGDALDPQRNNIGSIDVDSDDQLLINVEESGCYRAYGVNFKGTVTLSELNGSDVQGEVEQSKCKLDWGAISANGSVEYSELGSWQLVQGDHLMRIDCDSGCANETIWLTSIDAMEADILNSPMVYVGGSLCCLGIFLLPLAGVLQAFSQNRKQNVMMVVGPDGQLMPLTDLTPEVVQSQIDNINQGATEGVGFDVRTGEYMKSDNNISNQQMDGARDVRAGSMLTTEQVYALMRGDVESATPQEEMREQVADPFPTSAAQQVSTPTAVKQKPVKQSDRKIPIANNEDWQSWDED